MESVYNIHPLKFKYLREIDHYNYDFLKNEYSSSYYNLLNSLEDYKLLNIYRFLYLRILKINREYNEIQLLPLVKKKITCEEFNNIMNNFINHNIIKEIIILNSIQVYFI